LKSGTDSRFLFGFLKSFGYDFSEEQTPAGINQTMNGSNLVDSLRADCRNVLDRQFAAAATDRFWLSPELTNLLVEHVLVDGTVAFLAGVASAAFLDWWHATNNKLKELLPKSDEDPTPAQISKAAGLLAGADTRLAEELQRISRLQPGAAQISVARDEIIALVEMYNFEKSHAEQIGKAAAGQIAKRLAEESSG
jgi:hypothetical protein